MMLWKGKESNLLYMPLPSILPSFQKKPMAFLLQLCQNEVKSRLDSKFPEKVNKYNNTQVTYFLYQKSWKSKVHDEVPKELQKERRTERKREEKGESVGGREHFRLRLKDEWILTSTVKAILFWFYNLYQETNYFSVVIKMLLRCLGILP